MKVGSDRPDFENMDVEDGGVLPGELAEAIEHVLAHHPDRVEKVYIKPDDESYEDAIVEDVTGRRYMLSIRFDEEDDTE